MTHPSIQQTFDLAVQRHQSGRLPEAEQLFRQILAQQPNHTGALQNLGMIASQLGQKEIAVDLFRRAVALTPNDGGAQTNLGLVLKDIGQLSAAIAAYRKALALNPNLPEAHNNLGIALKESGQVDDAIAAYRTAISLRPTYAEAHSNLGNAFRDKRQLQDAIAEYRQAISLRPNFPEAHTNLGVVLRDNGQLDDAIAAYRTALSLNPNLPQAFNNLGIALKDNGQLDDAIAAYRKALTLNPNLPEALNNLGIALNEKGEFDSALDAYHQAIALDPASPDAFNNLGISLREKDQLDEAIAAYRRAIDLNPQFSEARNNLGLALNQKGAVDAAVEAFQQAVTLNPNLPDAYNNLGIALKDQARLDESLAAFRRAVALKPSYAEAHSGLVFTLHYHPNYDAARILEEHRQWDRQHAQPLRGFIKTHPNNPDPNRRLKIGYVSADFRQHATAFCTVPLFSHHDHIAFEIFCYASIKKPDPVTEQLKRCSDAWVDSEKLSDEELAERIRTDGIDILVDLSMHTAGNRLLVFARKPAPVQVSWIAAPCTTGLEAIDYRLTDPYLDPPGETDAFYSEKSIRLPDSFWCYDPLAEPPPPVNPLPAIKNGFITFGCLNNVCKLNAGVLSLWSQVLKAVPTSRLLLRCPKGSTRDWALRQLNIEPDRVQFADRQPRADYLMTYHRIDAMLDTFPYNGHMTSLDALWMGVPVISLLGKTVVGRAGLSQLSNLGLPELVARDESEFVNIATKLAGDLPRLAKLRSELRPRMQQSPLMDASKFARNVEAAYHQMWRARYSA
jgi:protein O-GlcNAc transferase